MRRWKCRKCWYVYDPRVGDPDGGIPPGTPFEKIPDDWRCPVCGATKADFYVLQAEPPPDRPDRRPIDAPRGAASAKAAPDPAPPPPSPRAVASPPVVTRVPSAPPAAAPMWTVGSLKGVRQGHDKT